ncbi:sensor histidine kinase [Litoribacter populi]|uniref:sensor histidine kinase n=1 Tax=Litoribacter populi TaxID=2598460 RepID=UPI001F3634C7|nr:sensor histidine kinase [Litoribacter populi]
MEKTIKKKSTTGIFNSLWKFLLLNLGIVVVLSLFYCPTCLMSFSGFLEVLDFLILSFLLSCSLSFGGERVDTYFEERISWVEYPIRRLLFTAGTYFLYTFIISFILFTLFVVITVDGIGFHNMPWDKMIENTKQPIAIAFVIITIFITRSWLVEWRKAAIEAEQLKTERIASRYQSLKDQLNPHFLFNSLNALSHLVYENADKSAHFIRQLSNIYRYVLDVQQEELIPLERELEFASHYLTLQKLRFEESLRYNIMVNGAKDLYLPPLSLQLLLENAIKHNVASMAKPLIIEIEQKGNQLWVSNNFQPKSSKPEESSGIGLDNIKSRYELLSNQEPEIAQENSTYTVKLPLLTLSS